MRIETAVPARVRRLWDLEGRLPMQMRKSGLAVVYESGSLHPEVP